MVDTLGGPQQVATVNEDGLNDLILDSRKPSAKALRRWITRDVLPSIRRHGGYLTPEAVEQVLADPDTLIRLATDIKAARAEIARREAEVVELTPRAQAWDALADSAGDYDMRDAAQILCRDPFINIGRNRLAKHLREIGWLDHRGIPYQRYVDQHLLDSKPQTRVSHRTGERIACDPQVRITLKGLGRLHHLLGGTEPLAIDTPTDTDPLEAIA